MKYALLIFSGLLAQVLYAQSSVGPVTFSVSFAVSKSKVPLDGRVLLILAKTNKPEPREQVSDAVETAQLFGLDVNGLQARSEG